MNFEVCHNDAEGFMFEVNGVLVTVRRNADHGIRGSVAVARKDGNMELVEFHGGSKEVLFPVVTHAPEVISS